MWIRLVCLLFVLVWGVIIILFFVNWLLLMDIKVIVLLLGMLLFMCMGNDDECKCVTLLSMFSMYLNWLKRLNCWFVSVFILVINFRFIKLMKCSILFWCVNWIILYFWWFFSIMVCNVYLEFLLVKSCKNELFVFSGKKFKLICELVFNVLGNKLLRILKVVLLLLIVMKLW